MKPYRVELFSKTAYCPTCEDDVEISLDLSYYGTPERPTTDFTSFRCSVGSLGKCPVPVPRDGCGVCKQYQFEISESL